MRGPSRTLGKSAFRAQLPHATSQWATMNVKEQAVYAIVRTSGHQEKVAVGDELLLNRLAEQPGASVELAPVLLVVDGETVTSDPGALSSATVTVEVLEHLRGPKIDVFKYKNKTGYKRRQGHRQEQTIVKVTGIELGA